MKKLNYGRTAFLIISFALAGTFAHAQTNQTSAEPAKMRDDSPPPNPPAPMPTPPPPSAPRPVKIPAILETTLPNGLRVAVIERKNVPLVSATLLVKSGARAERENAGLADLTASLLLKGTKTRSATQIAEEIEFLGGDINSGANWASSNVSVNVTSDKIEQALTVMADTILNPSFAQSEIDLLKTQTLDELNVALKQPGTLANFVAARYTFGEHSAIGTPESLAKLNKQSITDFYKRNYAAENSVLIFVGDISQSQADKLAQKMFGKWSGIADAYASERLPPDAPLPVGVKAELVKRILVIDLPNSGQAAVIYTKRVNDGRSDSNYYPAIVANSVLGGGYSSRLNMEIRIKRGLSYGAGSSFAWRETQSNFTTRGQTKNVSAAEVAELTVKEIEGLTTAPIESAELLPRKLALTGGFGRELSTNGALTQRVIELYTFDLKPEVFGSYITDVDKISDANIKSFVSSNITGGDMIIVGDYKIFADDLKKRFPNQKIEVIPANRLDLNRNDLKKQGN